MYGNIPESHTAPQKEASDILPALADYEKAKRQYRLNILTQDGVNTALKKLVVEINEFLVLLYSNTTSPDERAILGQIRLQKGK